MLSYLFIMGGRFLVDLHRIIIAPVPEILFVYIMGQVEVGLIWHDQIIENPFHYYLQGLRTVYTTSNEKLCLLLSGCVLHEFCMNETSSLFKRTCLTSVTWPCAALSSVLTQLHDPSDSLGILWCVNGMCGASKHVHCTTTSIEIINQF